FDHVSFTYPNTEMKVLDDVSFVINPGEKVGIIGRIGSGKSTIARLIMGLYAPVEGAILADDTDYRQIDPADLRRNIAYIALSLLRYYDSGSAVCSRRNWVSYRVAYKPPSAIRDVCVPCSTS
ncbi:MAG: ATP-binding cassette domain-containing protein, partial [Chloroflexi bacterium]|nr:ATP-binding cassette domain-containing protein [Chloroflexota bacterium]